MVRYILLFISGWLTVLLINFFYDTIVVFSVAGTMAALLNYPVVWLSRYMPRWLAITVTFLVAIAISGFCRFAGAGAGAGIGCRSE
jgi:predicted PurR-regulated permease PerM